MVGRAAGRGLLLSTPSAAVPCWGPGRRRRAAPGDVDCSWLRLPPPSLHSAGADGGGRNCWLGTTFLLCLPSPLPGRQRVGGGGCGYGPSTTLVCDAGAVLGASTDCYYDAAAALGGPTCLHMNRDRRENDRPPALEDRLPLPPPRLALLVCDAGAVLGASTDCYYDAAAARGGPTCLHMNRDRRPGRRPAVRTTWSAATVGPSRRFPRWAGFGGTVGTQQYGHAWPTSRQVHGSSGSPSNWAPPGLLSSAGARGRGPAHTHQTHDTH